MPVAAAAVVNAVPHRLLERTAQRIVLDARRGLTGRVRLRVASSTGWRPATWSPCATSDTP